MLTAKVAHKFVNVERNLEKGTRRFADHTLDPFLVQEHIFRDQTMQRFLMLERIVG